MKLFSSIPLNYTFNNSVITIGSFDGVHVGHQQLLKKINSIATTQKGESVLITFNPHPRTIIQSKNKIHLLQSLDEKIKTLEQTGLQNLVIVPFTREFSQQNPEDYIVNFLVQNFNPKVIVIGYNHRFGKNREGDIALLNKLSKKHNYSVEQITKQQVEDISVSSTKIRNALQKGEIETANTLLGRAYSIFGHVVKGRQLGRKIGFPTANIIIQDEYKLIPQKGVYAVKINFKNKLYNGMLNIGTRPTIGGTKESIEANIFDFTKDIYGEVLEVQFIKYIREERKFNTIDELTKQLIKDKARVLNFLLN